MSDIIAGVLIAVTGFFVCFVLVFLYSVIDEWCKKLGKEHARSEHEKQNNTTGARDYLRKKCVHVDAKTFLDEVFK